MLKKAGTPKTHKLTGRAVLNPIRPLEPVISFLKIKTLSAIQVIQQWLSRSRLGSALRLSLLHPQF
ncbi:hypothetical protein RchiOBHm_Chr1g0368151 [Rosa chinensis]|uniref:Uncharacterized protein n=1 Tax=Rosa chinensis TaxID=74649 RepID=A0A2P6SKP7_ROSCH|nr:hypothetical protein RchiOBHm_Chr1g0368151 [Rosa chinensis]